MNKSGLKVAKPATAKSETDITNERAGLVERQAAIDAELEGIGEKHAGELAADSPNEKRLDELEEIRERFTRERERVAGRIKVIDERLLPAARLAATRVTMEARVKERQRLRDAIVEGHAKVLKLLEPLRELANDPTWNHPHPAWSMAVLAEEIAFDAKELGEDPPALEKAPHIEGTGAGGLREFFELASRIVSRVPAGLIGTPPYTQRGREAQRKKVDEDPLRTRVLGSLVLDDSQY